MEIQPSLRIPLSEATAAVPLLTADIEIPELVLPPPAQVSNCTIASHRVAEQAIYELIPDPNDLSIVTVVELKEARTNIFRRCPLARLFKRLLRNRFASSIGLVVPALAPVVYTPPPPYSPATTLFSEPEFEKPLHTTPTNPSLLSLAAIAQ